MTHFKAEKLSRREFLEQAAAAAASAAAVGMGLTGAAGQDSPGGATTQPTLAELVRLVPTRTAAPKQARVVIVKDARAFSAEGKVRPEIVKAMLEAALMALSGTKQPAQAYRKYFREDDFVALKYNELGGAAIVTAPALREAMTAGLIEHVGIDAERIVPIGRVTRYRGKYRGWSRPETIHTTHVTTSISSVFAEHATAIVSMPVCKTHSSHGVTGALKLNLGSINSPYKFCGDENWPNLWKNLPELNSLATFRKKTRLIVMDALRPQYDKGPNHNAAYRFYYNALIVSTDPVAIDAVALKTLEDARRRQQKRFRPIEYGRKMLAFAEAIGVGVADQRKIRISEIDLSAGKA
jgi:hypothetical protein